MDRLAAMQVLLAVVEGGSLSAAGRSLGMPLPTVSRRLTELETHLQTRLLERSTRRLSLTDSGWAYVAACRRILAEVEEAERTAAGEYTAPRGELVVSAPIVFGRLHVLPTIIEFLRAYPEVQVQLRLADRNVDLQDEHVDLAVRIGELPDSSLVAIRIAQIRWVVCASPRHLDSFGRPARPEELANHPCVLFSPVGASTVWRFHAAAGPQDVAITPRLSVNTAEAAVDAAIAGVGITRVLSYQATAALEDGRLERILVDFEPPALPVHLIYARPGRLPLKLRAFLDFTAARLRARLADRDPL
jgi:DNA-binding transcriptional LysR family regulator